MGLKFFRVYALTIFLIFILFCPNLTALTVKEERDLGKEVFTSVKRSSAVVTDPYITDYVSKIGQKMVESSGNKLFDFKFTVIRDNSYNAFAVPGGYIFVHTGLIAAMEDESELAGILGHEIAHVNCRHISQKIESSKKISGMSLAGLAAGIMLGMNGADSDAVMGVISGTQAMGQSAMLAYSRQHEREADNRGLKYLNKAGYSPHGLKVILGKIRKKEIWTTTEAPVYLRTHPGTEERLEKIQAHIDEHKDPIVNNVDSRTFSDFNKVRVKIIAFYHDDELALKIFDEMEKDDHKKPLSFYGKALVSMKEGEYEKSTDYFSKALKFNALDPELIFDYGRTLFLKGDYKGAVKKLSSIKGHSSKFPETDLLIGRSYLEMGEYEKAESVFDYILMKNSDVVYALYYNGIAKEKNSKKGEGHLSLGKFYEKRMNMELGIFHYKKAVSLLEGELKKEAEKRLKEFSAIFDKEKKKKKEEEKEKKSEKD